MDRADMRGDVERQAVAAEKAAEDFVEGVTCDAGVDAAAAQAAEAHEEHPEPTFWDAAFRRRRKHGRFVALKEDLPDFSQATADTHAHLQMLAEPALQIARAGICGVGFIGAICDVTEDSDELLDKLAGWELRAREMVPMLLDNTRAALEEAAAPELFAAYPAAEQVKLPEIRIIAGCHPHNATAFDDAAEAKLDELLADPRVCALGEVGLDFHYDNSPRAEQTEVFRRQVRMAKRHGLPLMLHLRSAHDEAYRLLTAEGFPAAGTVIHCFCLGEGKAKRWTDAGCHIAIGGAGTFKKFDSLRTAATEIPAELILTETDAPFMTPEPMRGCECGPAHVTFTARTLAQVRSEALGTTPASELEGFYANARALFCRSFDERARYVEA